MSTHKTEHYHLHAWVAGDDFLRTEINENFAALDAAIKAEAEAGAAAVAEEANARAALKTGLESAIRAEADARAAAVQAETDARAAAVQGEATARTSAINAVKSGLESKISALSTALADIRKSVGGKAEIVVGHYVGDGQATQHIELGKMPHAVLMEQTDGTRYNVNVTSGGLALRGIDLGRSNLTLDSTGFTVKKGDYAYVNDNGSWYLYLAIFLAE